jgi:prolyl-tRNA editing enzyme YbaK/EbsC (Cys-tRNA(Pro) deacylase)
VPGSDCFYSESVTAAAARPVIGTLSWLPAADRPDLVAAPVRAAIQEQGLDCFVAPIDPTLADTAAFCAAYGVPLEVSANCVVVAGRRAEVSVMAACLVLATDRADVNKTIRKHLDVRKISFAGMAEAVAQTGMEYGGITPLGLPAGWPVLMDGRVAAQEWIVIGSGVRGSKIALQPSELDKLAQVTTMPLALEVPEGRLERPTSAAG